MGGFRFAPGARYRMPVLFGPTVGPRQGPQGQTYDLTNAPFTQTSVRFLSEGAALDALLPERFALDGDPVVTVEHTILHDLGWLGGRAYSMLGVKLPVMFDGRDRVLRGDLLTVLWENRPEPILSGREELGFAKLFCDLPEPQVVDTRRICRASWDGFTFCTLDLDDLAEAPVPQGAARDGTLHYAYRPPFDGATHEDCVTVMLSPAPRVPARAIEHRTGRARIAWHPATFEQLPTMFQVVNTLAALPVVEDLGGRVLRGAGRSDLADQHAVA